MKRFSLALFFALILSACVMPAHAASNWSVVQVDASGVVGVNGFFPRGTDTGSWDTNGTVAGNPLTVILQDNFDGSVPQRTIVTLVDCDDAHFVGTSPSGTCSLSIDTFTLGGAACQGYATGGGVNTQSVDCAYVVSGGGGAKHFVITRSGHSSLNTERYQGVLVEINVTGGTPAIDDIENAAQTSNANSHTMVATTPSGNDAIIQCYSGPAGPTTISAGPYSSTFVNNAHFAEAVAVNVSDGTAPTYTSTGGTSSAAGCAIAWKATPVTAASQLKAFGGVVIRGGVVTNSPASTISITSTSPLPNCTQSTAFSYSFNASGGLLPYVWTVASGSLQPGLSLSSAGVLSGSCSNASGTTTAVIQVCDSTSPVPQCAQKPFQQTAQSSPPPTLVVCDSISSPTCPNPPATGIVGTFYSYNFSAIGGTPPYAWTVSSGSIPLGLTLTSAGVFSGFPSTAGTYSFTAQVTDSLAATGTANFTVNIFGFSGNPTVAVEPQSWVTAYQGGQNLSTGAACTQSDAAGACARNLPKVCDSGHNCVHEQLGFGTNNHPATLLGLYQAGCDWTQLAQNKYLWVEVKKGSVLTGNSPYATALFGNPPALYVSPVKLDGLSTPMPSGSPCTAATNSPIGPYTLAGSVTSGTLGLGDQICQQTSLACAPLLYITCNLGTGANEPWRNSTSPVLPNCSDAGDSQIGPISLGMFTGGTPDSNNAHLWIDQTSGGVFTQSAQAAANGYFRLTTECDDSNTNIPCTGLSDQIPCFHSALDSAISYHPLCDNDLPSMFTIEATTLSTNNSNQIEQDGDNTSLSGFEVTIKQGQNQSGPNESCPAGVECGLSPRLISFDCGACGFDHVWGHGWDPGDPALHPGDPSQLSFASGPCPGTGTTPCYPVTPGTSPPQYNCPSWAYEKTNPQSTSNPPVALDASNPAPYNQVQYANGCGDDITGVPMSSGGYTWSEYFTVTKIHKQSSESHVYTVSNAANNLNPNGAGVNGPHKIAHCYLGGTSEGLFFGGTAIQPVSGVATDTEVRGCRFTVDPGYRFLSGNAGRSPQAPGVNNDGHGYGCSIGTGSSGTVNTSGANVALAAGTAFTNGPYWSGVTIGIAGVNYVVASVTDASHLVLTSSAGTQSGAAYQVLTSSLPNICPFAWAMKKLWEIKWDLRGLFDGWLAENMWPDGQSGEGVTIDVRTCSGGDVCGIFGPDGTPLTQTNDITLSNFILRNMAGGISFAPISGGPGNGGGIGKGMNRVKIFNGLLYNCDQNQFGGSKGCDLLTYGANGNTFVNGIATRTSNVASITFDVGTVAPNPLSDIQVCGPSGVCAIPPNQGGGTLPNGTLYVNFNGQREDPISPQTCVGGICAPGITGPCKATDGTTTIPCGTMVFSGGPYDATWNALTGAGTTGGAIQTISLFTSHTGRDYQVNDVGSPNQSGASGGTFKVTSVDANGAITGITLLTPGQLYVTANQVQISGGSGTGAIVNITAAAITAIPAFDCRTLPCINTQGVTNIWAPMCNGGTGGSTVELGQACHNCGASGNSQCPPFGCGDVGCATGAQFATDAICTGTGKAPACGPANATFQTYGFGIMNVAPGDIVNVTNCKSSGGGDGGFNTPPGGYPITGANTYACTAGVNGCTQNQNPASLAVLYPNVGANVSSGVTSCQLNNGAGFQRNFITDHFAFYTGGQGQANASVFGIGTQAENNQLTNSIFWFGTSGKGLFCPGAGCKNQEANQNFPHGSAYQSWDVTTNQIHHNLFLLPNSTRAAYYAAIGNLGSKICNFYDTPGNCTEWLNGSTKTPIPLGCPGASQPLDANGIPECLGLVGYLNGNAFPSGDCTSATLSACPLVSPPWGTFDYHNFALCPTCRAGGLNTFSTLGSDGLQLGPCLATGAGSSCTGGGITMVSIDAAIVRTLYPCNGSCGTGPWPD